jgi:hypothetical protein
MLGNLAVGGPFLNAPHEMQPEGAGCRDRQKGRMGCGLRDSQGQLVTRRGRTALESTRES